MRRVFYITCYNDPESAEKLMRELDGLPGMELYTRALSDQSDNQHSPRYQELAKANGWLYARQRHNGATAAKWQVVEHANVNGFDVLSQVSEDFCLTTEETHHPAFVSGARDFLKDATYLLDQVQEIPFVHWSCIRGKDAFGYLPAGSTALGNRLRRLSGMRLAFVQGDIALWNWPYTGRVLELRQIWRRGMGLVPGCESHKKFAEGGGGEWRQQWVSQGQGACLLAHPVRHTDRQKPEGSLP